jgi:hypothetical protein
VPHKKAAIISRLFLVSGRCFFQLPTQRIQGVTTILNQHMCSIGEMLQIVTFSAFDAQASDAVEQIARGFESMDGGFKKIGSAGFGVDVQRRADAENESGTKKPTSLSA